MEDVTIGDAIAAVAEEGGPQSAGLLANLMASSAREREWAEEQVRKGFERERDEWRDRALTAEAELAAVQAAFYDMIHPSWEKIEHFKQIRQSAV